MRACFQAFRGAWTRPGTKIKKYVLREQIKAELQAGGLVEAPKLDSTRSTSDGALNRDGVLPTESAST